MFISISGAYWLLFIMIFTMCWGIELQFYPLARLIIFLRLYLQLPKKIPKWWKIGIIHIVRKSPNRYECYVIVESKVNKFSYADDWIVTNIFGKIIKTKIHETLEYLEQNDFGLANVIKQYKRDDNLKHIGI